MKVSVSMNSLSGQKKIKGSLAASLTAFNEDLSLDFNKTISHGKWLLEQGLDGVVYFGTTGEGNSLNVDEKKEFIDRLVQENFPLEKVMIGTGACSLTDTVNLTGYAVENGIKDCLILPPFYYKNPPDNGLFKFFSEIIQQVGNAGLRIQIYHFPGVSQIPISHELIDRLLKENPENICGIKDSGGDLNNMITMCEKFEDFDVYAGSEAFLLPVLEAGGAGTITATGNLTSADCVAVYKAFLSGENNLKQSQEKLTSKRELLQKACDGIGFVSGLKEIMSKIKEDEQWCITRPPFCNLDQDKKEKILKVIDHL